MNILNIGVPKHAAIDISGEIRATYELETKSPTILKENFRIKAENFCEKNIYVNFLFLI